MRTAIALTAIIALVGCSRQDAPAEVAPGTPSDESALANVSGTYKIVLADGTVMIETIGVDGTYIDATADGAETERGRWRQQGEAICFDPDGEEPEACYAGGAPGPDGSFEIKDTTGSVTSSVSRIGPISPSAPAGITSPE